MNTTIETLNPRHYRMLDLCLAGWTNQAIADEVGLKYPQVSIVLNSPNFQHELALRRKAQEARLGESLADITKEAKSTLTKASILAAQRLAGLLDSENESIVRQSANDILDRSGCAKVLHQELSSRSAVVVLKPEDLLRIESVMSEIESDGTSSPKKEVNIEEPDQPALSVDLSTGDCEPGSSSNSNLDKSNRFTEKEVSGFGAEPQH